MYINYLSCQVVHSFPGIKSMCAAYHRRPIVHINGDGLDNRLTNLRPARKGEIVTTRHMTYAVNEYGQTMQAFLVRGLYDDRNKSEEDANRWAAYCARGEDYDVKEGQV